MPADARVGRLGVAQQQVVEIVKALALDARLLIMDEPTAALADHEVELLYALVRRLQERGIGVLYVSHRLTEVFDLSEPDHRAQGRPPGDHAATPPSTTADAAGAAHGRPRAVQLLPRPGRARTTSGRSGSPSATGATGSCAASTCGCAPARCSASAACRAPGRSALARALFGVDAVHHRRGHARRRAGPAALAARRDAGRHRLRHRGPQGRRHRRRPVGARQRAARRPRRRPRPGRGRGARTARVRELLAAVEVRAAGEDQEIRFLSGGNQQKVVLARWLALGPQVLLFDEPTRGIDVGAKSAIHDLVRRLARDGAAVLMISSELPELLGMSDRIVVMRDGRIAGELPAGATEEDVVAPGRRRRARDGGRDEQPR